MRLRSLGPPGLLAAVGFVLVNATARGDVPGVAEAERRLEDGDSSRAELLFAEAAREGLTTRIVDGWVRSVLVQGRIEEAVDLAKALAEEAGEREQWHISAAALEAVAESRVANGALHAEFGVFLALAERYRDAVDALEKARDAGLDRLDVGFYLGSALWEVGKPAEALEIFESALDRHGRHPALLGQYGRLLVWSGKFAEAVEPLSAAARARPGDVTVRIDLARALDGAGETERALAEYTRAVALAPAHGELRYQLARLARATGRDERALQELETYRHLYREEQARVRREGLAALVSPGEERRSVEGEATPPGAAGEALKPGIDGECEIRLHDVAPDVGLDFVHDRGTSPARHLPETMGAGLSWLDFDGDGWLDLYAVDSGSLIGEGRPPDRLYRNLGDGRFEDVSERARTGGGAVGEVGGPGIGHGAGPGVGQGSLAADFDGDGDVDLYLSNFGPDELLRNDGRGGFEPLPVTASGSGAAGSAGWSSSAAAADLDGDGDLDLYVTGYLDYALDHGLDCRDRRTGEKRYCDPSLFEGGADRLLLGDGAGGFEDASAAVEPTTGAGRGLGVVLVDLDGDRDAEIYVANDLTLNFLFENLDEGTFGDATLLSGTAVNANGRPEAGMGVAVADVDSDLDPDLAVTNFDVETNTLYENGGRLGFEDVSATSGFGVPSFNRLAFGITASDLDFDGDLDYYVANGHIFEQPGRDDVDFAQPDQIFVGDGAGRFEAVDCFRPRPTVARGLARADYDRDGDDDIAVHENGGPLGLFRNEGAAERWRGVSLRGRGRNRGAIGAVVTLRTDSGDARRWVVAGDSYQSSGDPAVLLHPAEGSEVRSLDVEWPLRGMTRIVHPPMGRYLVLPEQEE